MKVLRVFWAKYSWEVIGGAAVLILLSGFLFFGPPHKPDPAKLVADQKKREHITLEAYKDRCDAKGGILIKRDNIVSCYKRKTQ